MKRSDWEGDVDVIAFTQDDDDDVVGAPPVVRQRKTQRKRPPRNPLAISMGAIPDFYDSSIRDWVNSVMPVAKRLPKRSLRDRKDELALMEALGIDGTLDPSLFNNAHTVRKDLKNMLIFFSTNERNRLEISIFTRYCNMNVYVDTSTRDNAGLGLKVSPGKAVKKEGMRLTEYGGLRLAPNQPYNFDSVYVVDVYNEDHSQLLYRIDGAHSFTLEQAGRWANRSRDDANAELLYDAVTDKLWLVSTKAIEDDEEIFWWYGDNFSQSVTQPSEDNDDIYSSPSIRERLSGFYI